jgi:hypothetical protein
LAGAAIGAGVGTLTGAAVGSSLDEIEARNRAEIEARIGRPVPAGAVSVADVIAMTQAGVDENLIVQHIRIHGTAQVLRPGDLIQLQTNGVSARVVQAMQTPPQPRTIVREVRPPPPRQIIIEERIYPAPWGPPRPLPPPW